MEIHSQPLKLNLGAGHVKLDGYKSVDLRGEPDIHADVKTLPLDDESVDEILAVHLLEHLYRWEAPDAFKEWHRVLKPGGILVLELPDVIKAARLMLDGASERMGIWGLYGDPGYKEPLMVHKWGWSQAELAKELQAAGFKRIQVATPKFHKKQRDMRVEARK